MSEEKPATITIKRSHFNLVLVAIVFLAIGWFLGANWGSGATGAAVTNTGTSNGGSGSGSGAVSLNLQSLDYSGMQASLANNSPSLGSPDAPVTVYEYSDFQCPFCKRFHDQTFQQILNNYVKTGKVRFVYKQFPICLPEDPRCGHPRALKTAEASLCVADQSTEKFWKFHDLVFNNQDLMSEQSQADYEGVTLGQMAASLGLDTTAFGQCLESGQKRAQVISESGEGGMLGISATQHWEASGDGVTLVAGAISEFDIGTPYFIINGKPLIGAFPFRAFQQAFDHELDG